LSRSSSEPTPFFLDGPAGNLFCLHFPRSTPGGARRCALVLPPFAEELNKSRRMGALAARALQRAGHDVLLIDLYGTGDSAGDFGYGSLPLERVVHRLRTPAGRKLRQCCQRKLSIRFSW
jgi:alpha/beta superfamily hydrolase